MKDRRLIVILLLVCVMLPLPGAGFAEGGAASLVLASAEHITDLAERSEILVVNSRIPQQRWQYAIEVIADATGEANPSAEDGAEDAVALLDRLAIDAHEHDDNDQVAAAYDAGTGWGYIGFSESMRWLENRLETTRIKAISFSDRANTPRLYVDAMAIAAGGRRPSV